jgi:hypothetical protein
LRADGAGALQGGLQVNLPNGNLTLAVPPGHAMAVALRLGVPLRGDENLFGEPTLEIKPDGTDAIAQFLESLDLSGLGS